MYLYMCLYLMVLLTVSWPPFLSYSMLLCELCQFEIFFHLISPFFVQASVHIHHHDSCEHVFWILCFIFCPSSSSFIFSRVWAPQGRRHQRKLLVGWILNEVKGENKNNMKHMPPPTILFHIFVRSVTLYSSLLLWQFCFFIICFFCFLTIQST